MITNITLQNFKCFHHVSIDPKLITVFIGPNGTGKSAVMQALLLLKQSRNNVQALSLDGELIQFAPEAFMWHGAKSNSEGVRLAYSGYSSIDSEEIQEPIKLEVDLGYSRDAILEANRGSIKWVIFGQNCEISFGPTLRVSEITTPRGTVGYQPSSQINSFQIRYSSGSENASLPVWTQLAQATGRMLTNLKMVPASRGLARGVYSLGPESANNISGAGGLGQMEDNTATTLAYSRREVEQVSHLMKRITDVGFRVDTVPPRSAKPVSETLLGDFSLLAEGFGTNALVQLLFELVRTVSGATVLIEEPEIHLHPKAQADLASVLAEEAKSGNKQIVLTTHSEHVAGRLLTLVAEGKLLGDDLAIYSFDKDFEGTCTAKEIEVTERGLVNGGLTSFFETDLSEMKRYVEALRAKV